MKKPILTVAYVRRKYLAKASSILPPVDGVQLYYPLLRRRGKKGAFVLSDAPISLADVNYYLDQVAFEIYNAIMLEKEKA